MFIEMTWHPDEFSTPQLTPGFISSSLLLPAPSETGSAGRESDELHSKPCSRRTPGQPCSQLVLPFNQRIHTFLLLSMDVVAFG